MNFFVVNIFWKTSLCLFASCMRFIADLYSLALGGFGCILSCPLRFVSGLTPLSGVGSVDAVVGIGGFPLP